MLTHARSETAPVPTEAPPPSDALEGLIQQFQSPLLRYARRIVRNDETAQDMVQEAFVRWLRTPPERRPDDAGTSSWLYRVTHNLCVDWIRKESRMQAGIQQIAPATVHASAPSPARGVLAEEAKRLVDRLLDRLTDNQRTVIVLKVQEGRSYKEISEITGLSVSNVGFLIHKGLKTLGTIAREEELI